MTEPQQDAPLLEVTSSGLAAMTDAENLGGETGEDLQQTTIEITDKTLREAVWERDLARVKQLLQDGASVAYADEDDLGDSPLHYCVGCYGRKEYPERYTLHENNRDMEKKIIELLVAAAKQANALDFPNVNKETPLFTAIETGDLEIIKSLVNEGARLDNIRFTGESALHVATQHPDVLKYFLDLCDPNIREDENGLLPIHHAVQYMQMSSIELLVKKYNYSQDQLRTLLNSHKGFTNPLSYAIQWGPKYMDEIEFLLTNVAALVVQGEEEKSNIALIASLADDSFTFFENIFDYFISVRTEKGNMTNKDNDVVTVDYRLLACREYEEGQVKGLDELVRCGLSKLLTHPLIESLVYLKWKCIQPVFIAILCIYVLFLVLFNAFVVRTFIDIDSRTDEEGTNVWCVESYGWYIPIYACILVMLMQECMFVYLQKRQYFKRVESWVSMGGLALAVATPPLTCALDTQVLAPARHVACAALLFVWLRALFLLSRVPSWGHKVLMYKAVTGNVIKIFGMFIWLVLVFAACFMIEYQQQSPFDGYINATLKTMVMMTSEFGNELFEVKDVKADTVTVVFVRVLSVIFLVVMAVALMNFITGVAVSDVGELAALADVKKLEMQVELLSKLMGVQNTVLGKCFSGLSRLPFHGFITHDLNSNAQEWRIYTGTQTSSYVNIPTKLRNDIFRIAKKEKPFIFKDGLVVKEDSNKATLEARISTIEDNISRILQLVTSLKVLEKR